jgi:hypothetical protein
MKKLRLLLVPCSILLLMSSCASTKDKNFDLSGKGAKPKWVNAPSESCPKEYICAVGMGTGLNMSYSDARAEIAKSFKANIKSKFVSSLTSDNYKISESTFDEVEESTNEVITGVNIYESYEGKDNYYSYARLDRRAAGKLLLKDIKQLDSEIDQLYKSSSFATIVKVMPLYQKRELLAAKYSFITKKNMGFQYNFTMLSKKLTQLKRSYKMKIKTSSSAPRALVSKIKGFFGKNGVKLVEDDSFTHSLDLSFHSSKQFLKVIGFEKYQFVFDLKAKRKYSSKSSVITFKEYIVARDFDDCLAKALMQIDSFIEDKIYKLDI